MSTNFLNKEKPKKSLYPTSPHTHALTMSKQPPKHKKQKRSLLSLFRQSRNKRATKDDPSKSTPTIPLRYHRFVLWRPQRFLLKRKNHLSARSRNQAHNK